MIILLELNNLNLAEFIQISSVAILLVVYWCIDLTA